MTAKRSTEPGGLIPPVFRLRNQPEQHRPIYVLLTVATWEQLYGGPPSIRELVAVLNTGYGTVRIGIQQAELLGWLKRWQIGYFNNSPTKRGPHQAPRGLRLTEFEPNGIPPAGMMEAARRGGAIRHSGLPKLALHVLLPNKLGQQKVRIEIDRCHPSIQATLADVADLWSNNGWEPYWLSFRGVTGVMLQPTLVHTTIIKKGG